DPVTGTGDGHQPGEEAVDGDAHVPLLDLRVQREHRREATGGGRERRVGGDSADTTGVEGRQRGARVEAVPAEPQDDAADRGDGEVVRGRHAAAVALEHATDAGPEDDGAGEGGAAADGVDDGRAGEV